MTNIHAENFDPLLYCVGDSNALNSDDSYCSISLNTENITFGAGQFILRRNSDKLGINSDFDQKFIDLRYAASNSNIKVDIGFQFFNASNGAELFFESLSNCTGNGSNLDMLGSWVFHSKHLSDDNFKKIHKTLANNSDIKVVISITNKSTQSGTFYIKNFYIGYSLGVVNISRTSNKM